MRWPGIARVASKKEGRWEASTIATWRSHPSTETFLDHLEQNIAAVGVENIDGDLVANLLSGDEEVAWDGLSEIWTGAHFARLRCQIQRPQQNGKRPDWSASDGTISLQVEVKRSRSTDWHEEVLAERNRRGTRPTSLLRTRFPEVVGRKISETKGKFASDSSLAVLVVDVNRHADVQHLLFTQFNVEDPQVIEAWLRQMLGEKAASCSLRALFFIASGFDRVGLTAYRWHFFDDEARRSIEDLHARTWVP